MTIPSMTASRVPIGTCWPGGDYRETAILDLRDTDIVRCLGDELISGIEDGLGPWRAIGARLASGAFIELIEYAAAPSRGFELRVDSACNLRAALDETLALFGLDPQAVLWRSPLLGS